MRYNKTTAENVRSEVVCLGRNQLGILYTPVTRQENSDTAVLVMHSDSDYLTFSAGLELASHGFYVLCSNVVNPSGTLLFKLRNVRDALGYLRGLEGISKVVLFGHSGGATLMTAYQNIAENGVKGFQGDNMIVKLSDELAGLPAADGVMLIDPNWGNGAMMLLSLDPAVITEGDGQHLDPELNLFNPSNGFDPNGSSFSDTFVRKFLKAQGERNNRLIEAARIRLELIELGKGNYVDDEPFIVTGGASNFMNNKLYTQDIHLLSRTRREYKLLHGDGTETTEIVRTLRTPVNNRSLTNKYRDGILVTTVRTFLDSFSVRVTDGYYYNEDTLGGIDWGSSYCCTTGNVSGVAAPLLVMGMTAGSEFACVETILENAASTDKTAAFVEGATHMFDPPRQSEGQFGDTVKTTYDYIDRWLQSRFAG